MRKFGLRGEKILKNSITEDEFLKKRKQRQRKIRRRRIKLTLLLLLIAAVITGALLSVTVFFKIEVLTSEGSKRYTEEQIIAAAGISEGDNLIIASVNEERLKSSLPYIGEVKLERKLPNRLTIKVSDAAARVCLCFEEKYYPASAEGRLLECLDECPDGLPTVYVKLVSPKVGKICELSNENDGDTVKQLFEITGEKSIGIDKVDVTDSLSISFTAEGRFEVSLGTSNYTEGKLAHLAGMIKNIDTSATGKIDLSMWAPDNTEGSFVSAAAK